MNDVKRNRYILSKFSKSYKNRVLGENETVEHYIQKVVIPSCLSNKWVPYSENGLFLFNRSELEYLGLSKSFFNFLKKHQNNNSIYVRGEKIMEYALTNGDDKRYYYRDLKTGRLALLHNDFWVPLSPEWDEFDDFLCCLSLGYDIYFCSLDMHYKLWKQALSRLQNLSVSEVFKIKKYTNYCKEHGISAIKLRNEFADYKIEELITKVQELIWSQRTFRPRLWNSISTE